MLAIWTTVSPAYQLWHLLSVCGQSNISLEPRWPCHPFCFACAFVGHLCNLLLQYSLSYLYVLYLHCAYWCHQYLWPFISLTFCRFSPCFLPSVLWRCWLGGRKGIRPVKNWAVGCWRGYLSGVRCRLEVCMGMEKTGIPWDFHGNGSKISHGMGMEWELSAWEWELRRWVGIVFYEYLLFLYSNME